MDGGYLAGKIPSERHWRRWFCRDRAGRAVSYGLYDMAGNVGNGAAIGTGPTIMLMRNSAKRAA